MNKPSTTETNLYERFSQYNAEAEGDIDIIRSNTPTRPDLKYLKWMRGWIEVLKVDPDATYDVLPSDEGSILHRVGNGGMVHVRVTILGKPKEEWYPVESAPMRPVAWDSITPTQVNKSIKRGLVKCLALFGLAANLYLNDDMTEGEKDSVTDDIITALRDASTLDQLTSLYSQHADIISRTPKIKAMFTARRIEITKNSNQ